MSDQSTIQEDVRKSGELEAGPLSFDAAADAFLSNLMGGKDLPKDEDGANTDPEDETDREPVGDGEESDQEEGQDETDPKEEEGSEDGDEEDGEDEPESKEGSKGDQKVAPDDLVVEVAVGDETHKVSVKELKRLFGQEAALTKKSQEVSNLRKKAETDGAKYAAALERLFNAAKARWEPYSNIDMLLASRQMEPEAFTQLRKDALEAYNDFRFMEQELEGFVRDMETRRRDDLQNAAKEALKVLTDPKDGIQGWSTQLYDEIRSFAIGKGMDPQVVNTIVDPAAIKIIHAAMLYEKGKQAVAEKVQRKVNAPKKVLKTTTPVNSQEVTSTVKTRVKAQLKKTGKLEDAANAFLANWIED